MYDVFWPSGLFLQTCLQYVAITCISIVISFILINILIIVTIIDIIMLTIIITIDSFYITTKVTQGRIISYLLYLVVPDYAMK